MIDVKQLKNALRENEGKALQLVLPGGEGVPAHFHVTEVGAIQKDFIDCGGTQRRNSWCLLQAYVATDYDHRIPTEKLLKILEMGAKVMAGDFLPVEIEYEGSVISQYPVEDLEITDEAVILKLTTKHTDCLAKDVCGIPEPGADPISDCCTPGSGCC